MGGRPAGLSARTSSRGTSPGCARPLGKEAIETRGAGYVVRVEPGALDLQRFEELAHHGSRALEEGDAARASSSLGDALALWRGPALADLADDSLLDPVSGRLEELRVLALERRVEADLALGRDADVVGELEELIAEHPLRERPHGLLMTALYRSGRQADALGAYREARSVLVDELGIEPSAWLTELARRDPATGATAKARGGGCPERNEALGARRGSDAAGRGAPGGARGAARRASLSASCSC